MKKSKPIKELPLITPPHSKYKSSPGIICPYCKGTGFRLGTYTAFGTIQSMICDVCGGKRYIPA